MDVPPVEDEVWTNIVSGKVKYPLDFLAAKILLGRLTLKVKSNPSPSMLQKCSSDLHYLYAQNSDLPCVQRDMKQIFGGVK
jgi:hypothetical protein